MYSFLRRSASAAMALLLQIVCLAKSPKIAPDLADADPQLWNQRSIQSLVAGQRRGLGNSHRLFALTMFELWRREYKVTL